MPSGFSPLKIPAIGKKVEKKSPAKYLSELTNELTWAIDDFTSENTTVQRNLLLKLYQAELKRIGVIFEKNHKDYNGSILGKLDAAVNDRTVKDSIRKTCGGIYEDLKAQGYDPDRPATIPDYVDIAKLDKQKQDLNIAIALKKQKAEWRQYNRRLKREICLTLATKRLSTT